MAKISFRVGFSDSTTSGCSIARNRCRPVGRCSKQTGRRGWLFCATMLSMASSSRTLTGKSIRPMRTWLQSFSNILCKLPTLSTLWEAPVFGTRKTVSIMTESGSITQVCPLKCARWLACCRSSQLKYSRTKIFKCFPAFIKGSSGFGSIVRSCHTTLHITNTSVDADSRASLTGTPSTHVALHAGRK